MHVLNTPPRAPLPTPRNPLSLLTQPGLSTPHAEPPPATSLNGSRSAKNSSPDGPAGATKTVYNKPTYSRKPRTERAGRRGDLQGSGSASAWPHSQPRPPEVSSTRSRDQGKPSSAESAHSNSRRATRKAASLKTLPLSTKKKRIQSGPALIQQSFRAPPSRSSHQQLDTSSHNVRWAGVKHEAGASKPPRHSILVRRGGLEPPRDYSR